VTPIVNAETALVVGVPLIKPLASMDRPSGSEPEMREKTGFVNPVATSCWE
jgi:hypothetical protein